MRESVNIENNSLREILKCKTDRETILLKKEIYFFFYGVCLRI